VSNLDSYSTPEGKHLLSAEEGSSSRQQLIFLVDDYDFVFRADGGTCLFDMFGEDVSSMSDEV